MKVRNLVPITIIGVLIFVLSTYMFSALPLILPQYVVGILWLVPATIFGLVAYGMPQMQKNAEHNWFLFSFNALLVYFTSTLVFDIILFVKDAARLLIDIVNIFLTERFEPPYTSESIVYLASLFFLMSTIIFIYGILKGKYRYKIIKHTLYFDDLPSAFDGFKLVQISDVHAGSLKNKEAVQKGIDLIKAQNADLFVFTGDLVNNKAEEVEPYINHFSKIKTPFGQFSVLGNHDYGDYIKWSSDLKKRENLSNLKKYQAEIGFKLLLDENVRLEKDGQQITLMGVENWGLGFGERGDLEKALTGTNRKDFKILLSHDPTHWEAQVKNHPSKVHLTLAGHTHGMQFGIEAFGIKWSPVQFKYKHWAGIKRENDKIININRGFGFIGFSGRVGIWPEITVIELKRG